VLQGGSLIPALLLCHFGKVNSPELSFVFILEDDLNSMLANFPSKEVLGRLEIGQERNCNVQVRNFNLTDWREARVF